MSRTKTQANKMIDKLLATRKSTKERKTMKIKIKQDAGKIFRRPYKDQMSGLNSREYAEMIDKIEGKTIEVETEYLFINQYNTVPIPGVSECGLRIMDNLVEQVINDAREGKAKCSWCGALVSDFETTCPECKHGKEYLQSFVNRYRRENDS